MSNLIPSVSSDELNQRRADLAETVEARYVRVEVPAGIAAVLITTAMSIGARLRAKKQPG